MQVNVLTLGLGSLGSSGPFSLGVLGYRSSRQEQWPVIPQIPRQEQNAHPTSHKNCANVVGPTFGVPGHLEGSGEPDGARCLGPSSTKTGKNKNARKLTTVKVMQDS